MSDTQAAIDQLKASLNGCTFDAKGKLVLPDVPEHDDTAGLCAWLTCVFNLDPRYPAMSAAQQGVRGAEGHLVIRRGGGAPSIRFEPRTKLNTPTKLIETLDSYLLPTDGAIHAFTSSHCRNVAHVIRSCAGPPSP